MNIYINNDARELQDTANIADVLQVLDLSAAKGIALAVNNMVIPRAQWTTYQLKAEDKVTLIKATQGG